MSAFIFIDNKVYTIRSLKRLLRHLALLFTALLFTVSASAAETITYFHHDAQGSPVAATNQAGDVIWREQYQPYGERLNKEPAANSNTRWYTGHPQDSDTGLVYAGARYYDPVIGRFMGVDPKSFTETNPHSFNRYVYGNNNPYRYIDPDGESPVDIIFFGIDAYNLGAAIFSGEGIGQAATNLGISTLGLASPIPGVGLAIKAGRGAKAVGRSVKEGYSSTGRVITKNGKPVLIRGKQVSSHAIKQAVKRGVPPREFLKALDNGILKKKISQGESTIVRKGSKAIVTTKENDSIIITVIGKQKPLF